MKKLDILITWFEVTKTDHDNLLDGISQAYKNNLCHLIDTLTGDIV